MFAIGRSVRLATLATVAVIATMGSIGAAEARRGGGSDHDVQEWTYSTKGPVRGYTGFAGPGKSSAFCDYQRIPERKCSPDGSKCKITGWTLKQYCY